MECTRKSARRSSRTQNSQNGVLSRKLAVLETLKKKKKTVLSLNFLICKVGMLMPAFQGLSKTAQVRTLYMFKVCSMMV